MTTAAQRTFNVPTRAEVSANNQRVFDSLQKSLGFVPNIYAYFAKSETALVDYLAFQNRKSTLCAKEKEVINLVVSQENGCRYRQSAHTVLGKLKELVEAFFDAGYTEANLVDVVIVVGDKIISNYIHNFTGFKIDFPLAEAI